jgi:hypothetical protein
VLASSLRSSIYNHPLARDIYADAAPAPFSAASDSETESLYSESSSEEDSSDIDDSFDDWEDSDVDSEEEDVDEEEEGLAGQGGEVGQGDGPGHAAEFKEEEEVVLEHIYPQVQGGFGAGLHQTPGHHDDDGGVSPEWEYHEGDASWGSDEDFDDDEEEDEDEDEENDEGDEDSREEDADPKQ